MKPEGVVAFSVVLLAAMLLFVIGKVLSGDFLDQSRWWESVNDVVALALILVAAVCVLREAIRENK